MKNLIIIGYSGHAFVLADAVFSKGGSVIGYCDNHTKSKNPFDIKYLGLESDELLTNKKWIVGIGNNHIRERICNQFELVGELITVVHNNAIIGASSQIGKGSFLAAGAVINPLCKIGVGCIINTNSTVEHECEIGNYVHVAPGTTLAGNVKIGDRSFIGANAVIKQGIEIGSDVIIGAGTVVLKNIGNNQTIVGNPGKPIS